MDPDELIAGLMAMGFELDACKRAVVDEGIQNPEDAVEWIIGGHGRDRQGPASRQTPPNRLVLPVDPTAPSQPTPAPATTPSLPPIASAFGAPLPSARAASSHAAPLGGQYGEGEREPVDVDNVHGREGGVATRYTGREQEASFERRQATKLEAQARAERREREQSKQRVLQEIAADRARKLALQQQHTPAPTQPAQPRQQQQQQRPAATTATIQVRLPSGTTQRQQFEATAPMAQVFDWVASSVQQQFALVQAFPRREFTREQSQTVQDAGLVPSASLTVRLLDAAPGWQPAVPPAVHQPVAPPQQMQPPVAGAVPANPDAMDIDQDDEEEQNMSQEEEREEEEGEEEEEEEEEGEDGHMGGDDDMFGMAALARHQQEFAAAAAQVPAGSAAQQQQVMQPQAQGANAGQRAAALQAAAARQQQRPADQTHRAHTQRPSAPAPMQSVYHLGEVPSLQELALRMVTGQVVREASKGPTTMLAPVGQSLARTILMRMIKDKTLNPRTMPAFNICQLDELVLDTYQQTTNDLLYAIRTFRSLCALSIRSCTYVTDTGIGFLTALNTRQFTSLDISNIRLTDKALSSVAQFTALVTLALDGTEITGVGLGYLLPHLKQLRSLGIGNCKALKARDLQALSHVPHLVSLALNGLEIDDLDFLPVLAELQHLNLSSCLNLDPYGLAQLVHATPNLTSIYLTGTHVHDAGLIYLAKLTALHTVRLPHKANITDAGLRHLSQLPLTALDLSDYNNITDQAMQHLTPLANTLLRLSLANTKITDDALNAVCLLKALRELELDRTRITDACLACLEGLELQVLGLSGTHITDEGLLRGHISGPWIQRLSLGNTRVTDEGVMSLRLPNLTHLNLDGTQTTTRLQLPGALPGLPKLTSLRQRVEPR